MRNVQAQNIINSNVAPVNSAALDCDDNDGDATMRDDSRAECILKNHFVVGEPSTQESHSHIIKDEIKREFAAEIVCR